MYGSGMDNWLVWFAVICVAIGLVIGALVFWLIPLLWNWLVPMIHAATA